MNWMLAIILKPFILAAIFALIVMPIERVIEHRLKAGKLKRLLFFGWRV